MSDNDMTIVSFFLQFTLHRFTLQHLCLGVQSAKYFDHVFSVIIAKVMSRPSTLTILHLN